MTNGMKTIGALCVSAAVIGIFAFALDRREPVAKSCTATSCGEQETSRVDRPYVGRGHAKDATENKEKFSAFTQASQVETKADSFYPDFVDPSAFTTPSKPVPMWKFLKDASRIDWVITRGVNGSFMFTDDTTINLAVIFADLRRWVENWGDASVDELLEDCRKRYTEHRKTAAPFLVRCLARIADEIAMRRADFVEVRYVRQYDDSSYTTYQSKRNAVCKVNFHRGVFKRCRAGFSDVSPISAIYEPDGYSLFQYNECPAHAMVDLSVEEHERLRLARRSPLCSWYVAFSKSADGLPFDIVTH